MVQALLDQFQGLTLPTACLRRASRLRSPESLSLPLMVTLFSPFLTLETYCARLTGSSCDITYDMYSAHFPPQADEARTDQFALNSTSIREENYCNKNSTNFNFCEQYSQEQPIKKFCMSPSLLYICHCYNLGLTLE